ncbi:two-component response regulator ARR9-like isoform X2 [Cucurbita pepo subsp. pepo]|uniref:two-component response regulator ARR9-like isoform X2 n=1 Tax=Cucurbita pepo subsp. pepo TaxID=3664 RepID=UPI000C9D3FFC|nr:two-component response regulator ARR9-like isoform X2 [Cucurbita pepo subsp. pepo]
MELMKAGDVEEEEEEEEEEEVVQQQQQQQQQHFHVLAVDDSLLERKVLEKLLTISSSCEVTCVDSGDKALRYLGLLDDLDNFSSPFSPPRLSQQQIPYQLKTETKYSLYRCGNLSLIDAFLKL